MNSSKYFSSLVGFIWGHFQCERLIDSRRLDPMLTLDRTSQRPQRQNIESRRRRTVLVSLLLHVLLILGSQLVRLPAVVQILGHSGSSTIFGKVAALLAIVSSFLWLMTTAMATGSLIMGGFFRLASKDDRQLPKVLGSIQLLVGMVALAFVAVVLGHSGQLTLVPLLLVSGTCVALRGHELISNLVAQSKFAFGNVKLLAVREKVLLLLLLLYLVPKYVESFVPSGQGDPLYYHVYSAWSWVKAGAAGFDQWNPWFLQGGLFEYLYALLGVILREPMALLVASQVLHGTVTLGLSSVLFFRTNRLLGLSRGCALLAGLAFVLIARDPLIAVRAKNDGFLLVLGLGCWYCLAKFKHECRVSSEHGFVLIFLAAGALATKITSVAFLIPMFLIFLFSLKGAGQSLALRLTWFFVAMAPLALSMMVRNWTYTNNPIFPALPHLLPSPMMNADIIAAVDHYGNQDRNVLGAVWTAMASLASAKPYFSLALPALIFMIPRRQAWVYALAGGAILISAATLGTDPLSDRFVLFLLAILSCLATVTVDAVANKIPLQPLARWAGSLFALGLVLFDSGYELPLSRLVRRNAPFLLSSRSFFDYLSFEKTLMGTVPVINERYRSGVLLSNATSEGLFFNIPIASDGTELRANLTLQARSVEEFRQRMAEFGFVAFLRGLREFNKNEAHPFYQDLERLFKVVYRNEEFVLYEPL